MQAPPTYHIQWMHALDGYVFILHDSAGFSQILVVGHVPTVWSTYNFAASVSLSKINLSDACNGLTVES